MPWSCEGAQGVDSNKSAFGLKGRSGGQGGARGKAGAGQRCPTRPKQMLARKRSTGHPKQAVVLRKDQEEDPGQNNNWDKGRRLAEWAYCTHGMQCVYICLHLITFVVYI